MVLWFKNGFVRVNKVFSYKGTVLAVTNGLTVQCAHIGRHVMWCLVIRVCTASYMSRDVRKPVFGVFRPGPTQIGLYNHRIELEALNFEFRKKRDCSIRVAKTKTLISFAVTAKLICVFVFAYAKIRFSLTSRAHMIFDSK